MISSPPSSSSGAVHASATPVGDTSSAVRSVGLSGLSASAHCTASGAADSRAAVAKATDRTAAAVAAVGTAAVRPLLLPPPRPGRAYILSLTIVSTSALNHNYVHRPSLCIRLLFTHA